MTPAPHTLIIASACHLQGDKPDERSMAGRQQAQPGLSYRSGQAIFRVSEGRGVEEGDCVTAPNPWEVKV